MDSPTLDDIYDACGRLDESDDKKNTNDYAIFISGAKSADAKVKKLSAQMIVRYWKNFTEQRNVAFYSLVSILEDRNPETRKAIIRELSQLVKTGELVDKIADVLSQMLQQTDDQQEMSLLVNTLVQFLKSYPKDVLSAIFLNIIKSEDEAVRIRLLKFINEHLRDIPNRLMNGAMKSLIEGNFREVMKDVTASEFDLIFDVMRSLSFYQTVQGRVSLYKIVVEQIKVDKPFPAKDIQRYDQILYFIEKARALLSINCKSTDLVNYLIVKGLAPMRNAISPLRNRLLRTIAQISPYAGMIHESVVHVFLEYFISLIPPLPSEIVGAKEDDVVHEVESSLKLSELEPTIIALYHMLKENRLVFGNFQREKHVHFNWPKRFLYLAGLLQNYMSTATAELKAHRAKIGSEEEDKEKMEFLSSAIQMADNVYKICKDLVHSKPLFSIKICPSWKKSIISNNNNPATTATTASSTTTTASKRKITNDETTAKPTAKNDGVKEKKERFADNYYVPPSGKYSSSLRGFPRGNGANQGRGRGAPRGGGGAKSSGWFAGKRY